MLDPWYSSGNLLCPYCFCPLRVEADILQCSCGQTFSVNDDGVVTLVKGLTSVDVRATIDAFAYKWQYAPAAVQEERERVATEWFLDRFGGRDAVIHLVLDASRILDAGCGVGNLTKLFALINPAATIYAVDLSPAVHMVPKLSNVRRVRADIVNLPILGEFDIIVSDGVLHHTEDTRISFLRLVQHLAPGGHCLFYVYKKKAPVREFADDHIRSIVSKLPFDKAMKICKQLTDLGRQLREAKVTIHVEQPIDVLGIPAGDHDLHRLIYWHFVKLFWDDGGNRDASIVENFDWYAPPLAHRHTREEVEEWLWATRLNTVAINEVESGFAVHATKPAV